MMDTAPVWDLDLALSELVDPPVVAGVRLEQAIADLADFYDHNAIGSGSMLDGAADLAALFDEVLIRTDPLLRLVRIMSCWYAGRCWADGTNTAHAAEYATFQHRSAELAGLSSRLNAWAARLPLPWLIASTKQAGDHLPWLQRCGDVPELPDGQAGLLADLDVNGRDALIQIHTQLSAAVAGQWDGAVVPAAQLHQLLADPDPSVRHRAHSATKTAWSAMSGPASLCLNALAGRELALARRTGHPDILNAWLAKEGITSAALDALNDAVTNLLPTLRAFTRTKAALLHIPQLDYCDLGAPLPGSPTLTWDAAASLATSAFAKFCPDLGAHARESIALGWIDAQPRPGKRNRALCLPLAGIQSRVMLSFDGTYDSLHTLVHELGHGYHHRCHRNHTEWQRAIPLSLAETSSMFCESLLPRVAETPQQNLDLLHANLIGIFQTIACGYARYAFECSMMTHRRQRTLSADELTGLALDAQQAVYGDAFALESLPGYVWISHSHLYTSRFSALSYYFGLLFGLSLLDPDEPGTAGQFTALLSLSGTLTPAHLAERFGHDLASPAFWRRGTSEIARRVTTFTQLAGHMLAPATEKAGTS